MPGILILRKAAVEQITGLSGSSIDRLEASGNFPVRIKISPASRSIGWLSSEIDDWITSRPRVEETKLNNR